MYPLAVLHPLPVAISAHHVHLSQPTIERLFGDNYGLQPRVPLSQPAQSAACGAVGLLGPEGHLDRVRVLGPARAADQVELSRTGAGILGLSAPLRLAGDLDGAPGITIEGPRGK